MNNPSKPQTSKHPRTSKSQAVENIKVQIEIERDHEKRQHAERKRARISKMSIEEQAKLRSKMNEASEVLIKFKREEEIRSN